MKEVTLILPIYKGQEMTEKCLESINKNTRYPYKIIIIADEPEATEQIDYSFFNLYDYSFLFNWQSLMDIDLIIRKKREGVVSAYNIGMKLAKGDVCFIQNDAIYPNLEGDCWLTRLVKAVKEDTGAVVCANSGSNRSIGGWCCLIPRQTINKIGYLDERFNPAMMDDIDYAKRILIHKLKIVMNDSFKVEHVGSGTLKYLNDQEMKTKSWTEYRNKWQKFFVDGSEIDGENINVSEEEAKKYDFW